MIMESFFTAENLWPELGPQTSVIMPWSARMPDGPGVGE
jgi:hypothetical protein